MSEFLYVVEEGSDIPNGWYYINGSKDAVFTGPSNTFCRPPVLIIANPFQVLHLFVCSFTGSLLPSYRTISVGLLVQCKKLLFHSKQHTFASQLYHFVPSASANSSALHLMVFCDKAGHLYKSPHLMILTVWQSRQTSLGIIVHQGLDHHQCLTSVSVSC